ncbi:MAG TPA: carbamoyltransferase C-terminal domain-containing protein [Vicinamibacterales bacterium]|nr:carbamoyltransferase C-terminal domain-containing protein [Vicinamibacterales bacterium]
MAELYLGTARARLGPAAALIDIERGTVAACEENRLTRAMDAAGAGAPDLATTELLRFLDRRRDEVAIEAGVGDEGDIDPHEAHAEYAFRASGFDDALVVVCEAHLARGWSAWAASQGSGIEEKGSGIRDQGSVITQIETSLPDYPIAARYGELTESLGMRAMRDEHLVEALARSGHQQAASTQRQLGDQLLELLAALKAHSPSERLCLSGGLFFNTYFTTLAATSGLFAQTFIPPHPGRNGTALGGALLASRDQRSGIRDQGSGGRDQGSGIRDQGLRRFSATVGSPFLGPSYSDAEIKSTLDNCKLSYDFIQGDRLIEQVIHALSRGRLVGWHHGRLEWGPRALGHRSVLANPFAPHALDNLNGFLKRRPAYRSYGVSVPLSRLHELFEGIRDQGSGIGDQGSAPTASPFMQYEYTPRDLDKFRTILPEGVTTLRVQTVDQSEPRFLRLLDLWGQHSGMPVLVNTSFNGFHEPLVCSPRDAIRVFYGTGLDVLALEDFWLRK